MTDAGDVNEFGDDAFEDGEPGRLEGRRILIVDDDPDVRETFDIALSAEGAETTLAADGNAGVKAVEEARPEAVVLDMMLPGRSGLFSLESIKGREDSPVVVMVTANEGSRHQQYAEQMGADAYLLKPVPLGRLVDTLERLLGPADADAGSGPGSADDGDA